MLAIFRLFAPIIMKWSLKPRTELRVFMRRNAGWLIVSVVCVFIYIKQSNAPFWGNYTVFLSALFERPDDSTISGSIFYFFYELSFAFLTSFLFYLSIDYWPKRKKERSAFRLAASRIEEIDTTIGALFAFLLFLTDTGKTFLDLTPDKAHLLCGVELRNKEIYCHTTDKLAHTGEVHREGNPDCINQFYGLKEMASSVFSVMNGIMDLPYTVNLEDSLLRLLTSLGNNRLLCNLRDIPDIEPTVGTNGSITCNFSPEDVMALYCTLLKLRTFPYQKHIFSVEEADIKSIEEAKKTREEFKEKFPQSVEFYENQNS